MPKADYEYNSDEDRFVVFDDDGDVICQMASPHIATDKVLASIITQVINDGRLIFPTPAK